jgi:YD repeat-containing protein
MPSSGDDQTTTNEYGVLKTGADASAFTANNVLARVVLPEQTSGQAAADRSTTYRYNTLQEVTVTKEPAGHVVENTYDAGGRVTQRAVTTLASGFDNRVLAVTYAYNSRGQLTSVQQLSGVGGTVRDEVQHTYDGWGNPATMVQDPDSAVGVSGRAAS